MVDVKLVAVAVLAILIGAMFIYLVSKGTDELLDLVVPVSADGSSSQMSAAPGAHSVCEFHDDEAACYGGPYRTDAFKKQCAKGGPASASSKPTHASCFTCPTKDNPSGCTLNSLYADESMISVHGENICKDTAKTGSNMADIVEAENNIFYNGAQYTVQPGAFYSKFQRLQM